MTASTSAPPRVVVAVVTFDSAETLGPCLESLRRAAFDRARTRIVVVDNASSDGTVALARGAGPEIEVRVNDRNLGFGAACNVVLREAQASGAEFVFLLNPDAEVEPAFLDEALAVAAADSRVGAVQPLLLLAPDGARIDSAGNAHHYLGFGYCLGHGRPRGEAPSAPVELAFASGAALLVRLAALDEVGLFDEDLFLYGEDLDLGWRLRRAGWSIRLAPGSVVRHRHEFDRHAEKLFLLERNRWLVLLRDWSPRSLAVLALPLLANELAMLAIATAQGWLGAKLRALAQAAKPSTWRAVAAARRTSRGPRRVPDRELARLLTSRMEFGGRETPFLRLVGNPAAALAWRVARRLL